VAVVIRPLHAGRNQICGCAGEIWHHQSIVESNSKCDSIAFNSFIRVDARMSDAGDIVCWRCGESLAELSLPLLRLDECPQCQTELHVCKMCEFFDPTVAESCREPVAAEERDKEHANFCDYFKLTTDAYQPVSAELSRAEAELDELFGHDQKDESPGNSQDELEGLFEKPAD